MSSSTNGSRLRAATIAALGALALGASACGDLDNFTTVKDLRVLAVKAEPAGFLVPLADPSSLTDTTATVTALVVDPKRPNDILTLTAEGCPDFIDTITAASGKSSKLCPTRDVIDQLPLPDSIKMTLATSELPPGSAPPTLASPIEYQPDVVYGLTPTQLGLFFAPPPPGAAGMTGSAGTSGAAGTTGASSIEKSIQYNRDFGVDAIVGMNFTIGDESAQALKRIVYWPLLPPEMLPAGTACGDVQVPNANPELQDILLFRHRVDGIPTDPYPAGDPPTVSIATGALFVQPSYLPTAIQRYFLRVHNAQTDMVETQCRKELLTFQFFATAGTFSPPERTSELSPLLAPPDNGHIPIDSQYNPPKADQIPVDGKVTIWVVARDERAGAYWLRRDFTLAP